jgi:integrase
MTTETKRERGRGRIFARKDSAHLWCAYYLRGKEHRQSTGETDPIKAEKFLSHKLKEVGADQIGAKIFVTPQQERVTVNQILDGLVAKYKRGRKGVPRELNAQMNSHLKRLRGFFGLMRAMSVQESHVYSFIDQLRGEGKKNATINRPLQLLSQAYAIAVTSNPPVLSRKLRVELLVEDNVRKGKFTNVEAELIFASLPEYMKDVARTAYEIGIRAGELLKLKWSYFTGSAISVPATDTKNRKPRSIALTPQLEEVIARRHAARIPECELIFHNEGHAIRDYRKCWHTACVLNGLGKFYCRDCRDEKRNYISVLDDKKTCPKCGRKWTKKEPKYIGRIFHDFRRSAAHEMWKAGNSVQDCMEVIGQVTESMFKRYADLFSEEEKLARQQEVQKQREAWRAKQTKTTVPVPVAVMQGRMIQ